MLSDLITSFTTSVSSAHRALGYLGEALDMRRRGRIHRQAWQPHLDRTQGFVLSAAEHCRRHDKAVILGSGLLLDVPLDELSGMFGEIVLKDVVCLPGTRRQIRRYRNARFEEHDVTGLAEQLYHARTRGLLRLPDVITPAVDDDADLVVSPNILSQLWVVPRAFVGQQMRGLDPGQVDEWCAKIVEAHYAWLRSLPCEVCLVADHEAVKRDRNGDVVSRMSTVYDLELPEPAATWTWDIAPLGRENPHASKELIVGAWYLIDTLKDGRS